MSLNIDWHVNDTIKCQQLTADYLEEALDFIETSFFPFENICSTVGVAKNRNALLEMRGLTLPTAKDGISVIAIDTNTKKIVGVCLNKLQVKNQQDFENFAKNCRTNEAAAVAEFMATIDNLCDLFKHCHVDVICEIMFVATLSEYGGKGIARRLCEISMEIVRALKNGINVKMPVDRSDLNLDPVPEMVCSLFTSNFTQRIGKRLDFVVAAEKYYDDLTVRGFDFKALTEGGTPKCTLEYKTV